VYAPLLDPIGTWLWISIRQYSPVGMAIAQNIHGQTDARLAGMELPMESTIRAIKTSFYFKDKLNIKCMK
jgi:hypothetical protein